MTYFVVNPYNCLVLNIDNPHQLNTEEINIPDSFKNLLMLVKPQIENLNNLNVYFEYNSDKTIEVGSLKHVFIHRYVFRGGFVFLALYKCLKKTKLLWYYTHTNVHNGGGFSTQPSIEVVNNLKIDFYDDEHRIKSFKKAKKDMIDNEKKMILKYLKSYKYMSLWNWLKNCPLYHRN